MAAKKTGIVAAILAAGGRGTRFSAESADRPKQFLELKGKPIYAWPLMVLLKHAEIELLVVTVPPELVNIAAMEVATILDECGGSKEIHVTAGGETRQESVWLGLELLGKVARVPEFVLIH